MVWHPSGSDIQRVQNEERNLRRQGASRAFYRTAKRFRRVGTTFSLAIALMVPLAVIVAPMIRSWLAAVAALWLFVDGLILDRLRSRYQHKGAACQERFDSVVLGLASTHGWESLSEEEIHGATRRTNLEDYADWYQLQANLPWPTSVLSCQQANAVWSRRQHAGFAVLSALCVVFVTVLGVLLAMSNSISTLAYFGTVLLPSLPLLLMGGESAVGHLEAAKLRAEAEAMAVQLSARPDVSDDDLRSVQDLLLRARMDGVLIPEWYYRLVRKRFTADMKYAAGV